MLGEWVSNCLTSSNHGVNMVPFKWDDYICFVLQQHADLDVYSVRTLKQEFAYRYVDPLGHQSLLLLFNDACLAPSRGSTWVHPWLLVGSLLLIFFCVVFLFCLSSSCVLCIRCYQPVSLNCPFLIYPSVFSNVYLEEKQQIPISILKYLNELQETDTTDTQMTDYNIGVHFGIRGCAGVE